MSAKALLVIAVAGLTGEPALPPTLAQHPTVEACEAAAKAAVEALALTHAERAMPARIKDGAFAAVRDGDGVWRVRYARVTRTDPAKSEPAMGSMIRATCRPL